MSSIYACDIPCRHRCSLGVIFPASPVIKPKVTLQWTKLVLDFNVCNADENIDHLNEIDFDKKYVIEQIRRFSHYKQIDEISKFVNSHYQYDGAIFLGKNPISVIQLITEDINHLA